MMHDTDDQTRVGSADEAIEAHDEADAELGDAGQILDPICVP